MAKFSMKKGGKEVGPASIYAKPHTMDGKAMTTAKDSVVKPGRNGMDELNISVAGISKGNTKPTKTSGIKIRGTGAATKGTMARGPMG
jgi:hypothetical protein